MRANNVLGALLAVGLVLGVAAPSSAHVMYERVYDSYDDSYSRIEVPHRHRSDGSIVVTRGLRSTYDPYYSTYSRPYPAYRSYGYDPYYDRGYAPYYRDNNLGRNLLGSALGYAVSRF